MNGFYIDNFVFFRGDWFLNFIFFGFYRKFGFISVLVFIDIIGFVM